MAEYITKDHTAEELKEELGDDFLDFLGYNPLLASIEVKLAAAWASPDSMARIEAEINTFPQVKEVFYQKNLLDAIHENVKRITMVLAGFALLLLLIAIALIRSEEHTSELQSRPHL